MAARGNIEIYLSEILKVPAELVFSCAEHYEVCAVPRQELLLQPGEICRHTYFVEKGLLRMYSVDRNGKEHIIQFAPENWLISDRSSLYFNEKSNYYIEAIEDTEVYELGTDFFTNIVERHPDTAEKNDILLQNHIRGLQNRVHSLLADSAEERYLKFVSMHRDLVQRVPQWMIASYLGITPESLSRVRKELVRKNFEVF